MGLLKAINSNNTYPTYYYNFNDGILFEKANAQSFNNGIPQYIKIDQDQGIFIFDDGKLIDFCFEDGLYYIEEASSPSYLFGLSHRQTIETDLITKYDFSFLGKGKQYLFINFKPLKNVVIAPLKPLKIQFEGETYTINFTLSFSLKMADPFLLLKQSVNESNKKYVLSETIIDKIIGDFRKSICAEIITCCNNVHPKTMAQHANKIVWNATSKIKFLEAIGCFLTDTAFQSISIVGENDANSNIDNNVIQNTAEPQTTMPSTPALGNTATQENADSQLNVGGSNFVFDTISFDLIDKEEPTAPLFKSRQTPTTRTADTNVDFSDYYRVHNNEVNTESVSETPAFEQASPPNQFSHSETTIPQGLYQSTVQPANTTEQTMFFSQQSPASEASAQMFPQQKEAPLAKTIDVGIEGLNLSYSEMSIKEPDNKAQNANIFFPFGEDKEWLCPCCLNEAIGDFCGFCGQQRVSPFRVLTSQDTNTNTEWQCQRCGTFNYLKYCSNCGIQKHQEGETVGFTQTPRFCPECGYDFTRLGGTTPKFCPECGIKF